MSIFYELNQVPAHSVLLHSSRQEAIEFPKGDIRLGYCLVCGFISNVAFDPGLQNYLTHNYEATQAYSDTFNTFHRNLAERLINEYDLHEKRIVEIGCGQGEFLDLMCSLGRNNGGGFDPAYVEGRWVGSAKERVLIIKDYYTEESSQQYPADFLCCKMTLEHIHEPFEFLNMVARSVRNQPDTIVFFQVPNTRQVLQEVAFWDIYYEHCSYFSQYSLNYLFELCGFQVIKNFSEYDDQYLLIEARAVEISEKRISSSPGELSDLEKDVAHFKLNYPDVVQGWRDIIRDLHSSRKKVVIWGGSSKTVAFLTTLDIRDEIEYVIDINPNKHGTYLAGSGQEIVSYEVLKSYKPDLIIVMNPVYMNEIEKTLNGIGVSCHLIAVNEPLVDGNRKIYG